MTRIAVADGNNIFCDGLKTMLEQVDDFHVDILDLQHFSDGISRLQRINVLMVDDDVYLSEKDCIHEAEKKFPAMRTIVMTMDREWGTSLTGAPASIHKGLGKQEYRDQIRRLAVHP